MKVSIELNNINILVFAVSILNMLKVKLRVNSFYEKINYKSALIQQTNENQEFLFENRLVGP